MDTDKIRRASAQKALKYGFRIPDHLPVLNPETVIRSAETTTGRFLCLCIVTACGHGFSRKNACSWLKSENLVDALSSQETDFIINGDGDPAFFKLRVESAWALAWVLGLVPYIDLDRICADDFVKVWPDFRVNEDSHRVRTGITMRPAEEIVSECDLAYCLHWGIRQAFIDGEVVRIDEYTVIERRYALEWVISEEDWDDISLDT